MARNMCEYGIDNGAVEFWICPLLRLYKLCSLGPRGSQKKGLPAITVETLRAGEKETLDEAADIYIYWEARFECG